jgi:mannitol/fructose-specific phosphotransferase system IIA component (Ntr-type)
MNLARYIVPELISLELGNYESFDESCYNSPERYKSCVIESVLKELAHMLSGSGEVRNERKLALDLWNREKKAPTAIGHGIAIPHVRTNHVRSFIMGFARASQGIEFDAPDGESVDLFFPMAAPPYDDKLYLRVFKALAEILRSEDNRLRLREATDEHEVILVLRKPA